MNSFSEVIGQWETTADFAKDIGVQYVSAAAMKRRNSIPSAYWEQTVEAAKRRGIKGVTLQLLARLARKREAAA